MSASPDRPVYRHAEHAGNFADIHKHAVLAWIAASLADAGTPFCVLDTHAGDGIYPPDDAHLRTVQSVGGARNAPQALQPYLRVLHGAAGAHRPGAYPGSPWLLRALMGARDRLVLCENDPAACRTLRELFGGDNRVTVLEADGWARLRRWPPAGCRRGLLLTDPPYTGEGDYRVAPRRLAAAARR